MKPIGSKRFYFTMYESLYWSEAYQSLNISARNLMMCFQTELRWTGKSKNRTITNNGKSLNLLDFGCIRIFEPSFVEGVIKLYKALLHENKDEAAKAYKSWGFKNLNTNLVDALNIWALYLYGPLLEDKIRKIQDHQGASYAKELLGKVRKDLKKYGGVKPPREFVLVDRAAIGLGSVFMHLKAELNWHEKFEELIKNFNEKKVITSQKELLL